MGSVIQNIIFEEVLRMVILKKLLASPPILDPLAPLRLMREH